MKKTLFLLFISVLYSCKSSSNMTTKSEIGLIENVISTIVKKEQLNRTNSSKGVFFHINLKRINSNYYISKISLNSFTGNHSFKKEKILGFDTFIYNKSNTELNEVFFIPDSKTWSLLLFVKNNEIISLKKIENYELIDNTIIEVDF
ncbi:MULTISPECIES: hypothetical protein [Flavobacterium]|uniref:DUF4352 domain-containing protein n=1 Tax=Flavobacterium jumunjinense TaxID=998845 RepID=A0ABV5GUD3_9FLAO|nr:MULTISPECIES: hypothetical protein [Flavobacterium]